MKNTCLFALSSPEGNDNYFSKLINLKVDGKSLFRHVQCQMICEECRKLEMEEQIFCNHVKQTPHWLSSKKGARLKLLYLADPATAIKEFGGIIQDNFVPCFPRDLIHQMFSNPTYLTESTPEYVFITVDPSGGGMSQLAICSGYYTLDGSYVVKNPKTERGTSDVFGVLITCPGFITLLPLFYFILCSWGYVLALHPSFLGDGLLMY